MPSRVKRGICSFKKPRKLLVACWVTGLLVVALYYRTALGRNLWRIAIGLGLYASVVVMNHAALALNRAAFVTAFGYVRSCTFVLAVLIWTWALWSYAPKPPVASFAAKWAL